MDGILVHRSVTPSSKFAGSHLYLGEERHCESKAACPRTQRSAPAGLKPGQLDPEYSTLTITQTQRSIPLMNALYSNWLHAFFYNQ